MKKWILYSLVLSVLASCGKFSTPKVDIRIEHNEDAIQVIVPALNEGYLLVGENGPTKVEKYQKTLHNMIDHKRMHVVENDEEFVLEVVTMQFIETIETKRNRKLSSLEVVANYNLRRPGEDIGSYFTIEHEGGDKIVEDTTSGTTEYSVTYLDIEGFNCKAIRKVRNKVKRLIRSLN